MAREINAELLDTKIEKAQQDLVKAKHRYDAAAATLKDLLDKRDSLYSFMKSVELVAIGVVPFVQKVVMILILIL
mgnify:CR=1 FL=1